MVRSVSVVVPVFNESRSLSSSISKIVFFCRGYFDCFEVLCVDDGSTDDSLIILNRLKPEFPELVVLSNLVNHGKGYVVRQGLSAALFDSVIFMDCDLSTDLDALPKAVDLLDRFDVVIGDRHHPNSVVKRQPLIRRFVGRIFSLIPTIVLGLYYRDTQCGFKAFRGRVARDLSQLGVVDRWAFDVELLYLCKLKGYSVYCLPISWHDVSGSRVKLSHTWKMFLDVLRIKRVHGGS